MSDQGRYTSEIRLLRAQVQELDDLRQKLVNSYERKDEFIARDLQGIVSALRGIHSAERDVIKLLEKAELSAGLETTSRFGTTTIQDE